MMKNDIIEWMQDYLNGNTDNLIFENEVGTDPLQAFYYRTAKRLKVAYKLQNSDCKYWNDFLVAFRDFLLVFETGLSLNSVEIPTDNPFAIRKNKETGEYYSTFQFPEGVTREFAEQAFMRNVPSNSGRKDSGNLVTDSLIYEITGFTHFKSMSQKLAVYGALNTPDGYTTLVSLPTGGGKSLITQTLA